MIVMDNDRECTEANVIGFSSGETASRLSTTESDRDEALQRHGRGRAGTTHKIGSIAFMEGPVIYLDTPGRRLCCATKQVGYATRRCLRQDRSIAIKVASLAATSLRVHSDEIRRQLIDRSEINVCEAWTTCVERRERDRRGFGSYETRWEIPMCGRNEEGEEKPRYKGLIPRARRCSSNIELERSQRTRIFLS